MTICFTIFRSNKMFLKQVYFKDDGYVSNTTPVLVLVNNNNAHLTINLGKVRMQLRRGQSLRSEQFHLKMIGGYLDETFDHWLWELRMYPQGQAATCWKSQDIFAVYLVLVDCPGLKKTAKMQVSLEVSQYYRNFKDSKMKTFDFNLNQDRWTKLELRIWNFVVWEDIQLRLNVREYQFNRPQRLNLNVMSRLGSRTYLLIASFYKYIPIRIYK